MELDFAELFLYVSAALFILMFPVEILIIAFSRIELNKRKILLVFDFLFITLFFIGVLIWLFKVFPMMIPGAIIAYMLIYNLILFKVVKRFILKARAQRIEEEITEHILDALRSLADLDYKSAYEILEGALKKHPESSQLKRLKTQFDSRLKKIEAARHKQEDTAGQIKKISGR